MSGVLLIVSIAMGLFLLWMLRDRLRSNKASAELVEVRSMGEIVPDTLHPHIDPDRCIGSGGCVQACPEKGILALVNGRAELVNPLGCVGHGVCDRGCAVDAITLGFGTETRGVELPQVSETFETNQAGVYIVGELGGMGLIRNAVKQGAEAAANIAQSGRRAGEGAWDALVVGAGPAGISATLGLMDAGLDVQLFDREAFGGTIVHYPRAKVVMTGTLDLPLYGRVRRSKMSKEELIALWEDIRDKTRLPVVTGELVKSIDKAEDGMWTVESTSGRHRAANVVLALGRRGSPRKLGVPGEDAPKVSYRLLEPDPFEGKHVMVIGGGNSAVESALALADYGRCASVSISYRRTAFARCRGDNKRRIAEEIEAGRVRALMPTTPVSVDEGHVTVRGEDGTEEPIPNDAVIVQIGGTSPAKLLSSFGIHMVTKYGEA